MLRLSSVTVIALLIVGCSDKVIMSPLSPTMIDEKYRADGENQHIEGIIVYRAKPMIEVDQFIHINVQVSGQANSPLVLSDQCTPTLIRKIVSVADAEKPYRLHYEHGLLESYTFGATLTNEGILIGINTGSNPDQGKTFQNIASGVSSIAGSIPKGAGAPLPNCTSTPVFVGYENLPDQTEIGSFGAFK